MELKIMSEIRTKLFSFPFSVADIEKGPGIEWDFFTLRLKFTDYLENHCEVTFRDVSHFEFLVEDELDAKNYPSDGAVQVLDSPLIAKLVEIGELTEEESKDFQHLVVGFNGIGSFLVVVYRDLDSRILR